ncbi:MAG: hypothetical protein K2N73_12315 [Lachnospiraceae bacterium]|nr:hypothetical protein [Lachnospiraceae bacterium]
MDENIYILDMPDFKPVYLVDTEYGYSGKRGDKLKKLLLETSKFHCMYCFANLKGDRTDLGELEHSIEKTLSTHLVECVPNMAITCKNCNQSLKRIGEKQRKEKMIHHMAWYEKQLECIGVKCKSFCKAYAELRKRYCGLNKLNLQPFGMAGVYSGLAYRLQYDIMRAEFVPSRRYNYYDEDIEILEHHIRQFKLNDAEYKTKALIEFIEDTIEADGKFSSHENRYSNYVVDLFVERIKGFSQETVLKICERIYINYQLRHIIRKSKRNV